jgi:hypothetical protein
MTGGQTGNRHVEGKNLSHWLRNFVAGFVEHEITALKQVDLRIRHVAPVGMGVFSGEPRDRIDAGRGKRLTRCNPARPCLFLATIAMLNL